MASLVSDALSFLLSGYADFGTGTSLSNYDALPKRLSVLSPKLPTPPFGGGCLKVRGFDEVALGRPLGSIPLPVVWSVQVDFRAQLPHAVQNFV